MDSTAIVSLITSIGLVGSMVLNWVQYRYSKKGMQLNNYEKQLEIIEKLQAAKDTSYEQALKNKDLEIEQLKRDISDLRKILGDNTEKIALLQNAVNRLIGGGCKKMRCQQREPYPIEELGDVFGIVTEAK